MTISFSAVLANYRTLRYPFIRNMEEPGGVVHRDVYVDSRGFATIGAGFKVDSQASAILENMFTGLDDSQRVAAATAIVNATRNINFGTGATGAQAALNAINTALRNATGNPALNFSYADDAQIEATFNNIVANIEVQVDRWFGPTNGPIPESRERLALLSLAYNKLLYVGESERLRQALLNGDRAEAWYQIRYESNGGSSAGAGIAKRRYYESELFGLFQNPAAPTLAESVLAYRNLARNRAALECRLCGR